MKEPRLIPDIKSQDQFLSRVLAHQWGDGKAAVLKAATLFRGARNIIIRGMGPSLYISWHLQYQLAGTELHGRRQPRDTPRKR